MPDLKEMAVELDEGLRQQAEARRAANGLTQAVRRFKYQKGFLVYPKAWNDALATLPAPCHALAHCLLRRQWGKGETVIELGNLALGKVGITKYTKMTALKLLEGASLITIELRGRRKSPRVTLHRLE